MKQFVIQKQLPQRLGVFNWDPISASIHYNSALFFAYYYSRARLPLRGSTSHVLLHLSITCQISYV